MEQLHDEISKSNTRTAFWLCVGITIILVSFGVGMAVWLNPLQKQITWKPVEGTFEEIASRAKLPAFLELPSAVSFIGEMAPIDAQAALKVPPE